MGSHSDHDTPDLGAAYQELFRERADQMSKNRENLITAGLPRERELGKWEAEGFGIRRMPEDPLHARRISIGEADLADSAYLVFRGDPARILPLLRRALAAAESALGEPEAREE